MTYMPAKRISLRNHPTYSEAWVQQTIADDPSILGLGELVLRDRERIQPKAGRLDLLLQDPETYKRFEVELQLGATDEAHIIRTIEYWDIERRRYPQYEHCAVLVAEDVTSRFLNVISLFNGNMPIVAIQMQALQVDSHVTLVFTTVLNEMTRGYVDEDEDALSAATDRAFWEKERGTAATMAVMDKLFALVKQGDSGVELKYNKFYVGLSENGRANNYVTFRPTRSFVKFEPKIPRSDEIDSLIEAAGMETLEYDARWSNYRIRVTDKDVREHEELLRQLIEMAREERSG